MIKSFLLNQIQKHLEICIIVYILFEKKILRILLYHSEFLLGPSVLIVVSMIKNQIYIKMYEHKVKYLTSCGYTVLHGICYSSIMVN